MGLLGSVFELRAHYSEGSTLWSLCSFWRFRPFLFFLICCIKNHNIDPCKEKNSLAFLCKAELLPFLQCTEDPVKPTAAWQILIIFFSSNAKNSKHKFSRYKKQYRKTIPVFHSNKAKVKRMYRRRGSLICMKPSRDPRHWNKCNWCFEFLSRCCWNHLNVNNHARLFFTQTNPKQTL
jgi:hypothetical protein